MPPEILSLLIQLPVVAVFIWYFERVLKQFMKFLEDQRSSDRSIMASMLEELKGMRKDHDAHDQRMTEAISTMEERTRTRARAR